MGEMTRVNDLISKIDGFTSGDKAKPEDVKDLANQVRLLAHAAAYFRMPECHKGKDTKV